MDYHNFYRDQLYPLQDRFLAFFNQTAPGEFYLTGGTALSRFYFHHRYSDDLDFFSVPGLKDFREKANRISRAAQESGYTCETQTMSDHFFRVFVSDKATSLKIDMVDDVTFHWQDFNSFPLFTPVDNPHNILANKLTCVSRYEVKDIADIWIIAKSMSFEWRDIIDIAEKKSPVDPLEISKIIQTLPVDELKMIKWASHYDLQDIHSDLQIIANDILLGQSNHLKKNS